MTITPIYKIQGAGAESPYAQQMVVTEGVVTGWGRRGFFIQETRAEHYQSPDARGCSQAIFVFYKGKMPPTGTQLRLKAKVVDYVKSPEQFDKPVTQLHFEEVELIERDVPLPEPIVLNWAMLVANRQSLASFLNAHESMLFRIEAGAEFLQASNSFGDYVVLPADAVNKPNAIADYLPTAVRGAWGGLVVSVSDMDCWLPSFRTQRTDEAPMADVGDRLEDAIQGPLYFRSGAYQMVTTTEFAVERNALFSATAATGKHQGSDAVDTPAGGERRARDGQALSVMTMNCFNLDPKVERPELVQNPSRDIDDDIGSGQFASLARAVVFEANAPALVALQEIQDGDGAEQTALVSAENTLQVLVEHIVDIGGPSYAWADIAPESGADGGQPGGNIRSCFLYDPSRVELVPNSLCRLGEQHEAFEGSRKPLMATFRCLSPSVSGSGTDDSEMAGCLTVINVHLASKRHQHSVFATRDPGFDHRESTRIAQADCIEEALSQLRQRGEDYYVTGDFNDVAGSETVNRFLLAGNVNLVDQLPASERFDYNHRGKLHVLMHGIVSAEMAASKRASYEILHGNELQGMRPGEGFSKASDHAYTLAHFHPNCAV